MTAFTEKYLTQENPQGQKADYGLPRIGGWGERAVATDGYKVSWGGGVRKRSCN